MSTPIPTEHLPAVVAAVRADGVAYLNVGWSAKWTPPGAPVQWRRLAEATCGCQCHVAAPAQGVHCDCRGTGKPIHTLTVECPTTTPIGRLRLPNHLHLVGWCDNPDCDNGSVSVDVVVAELVPVVDESGPRPFIIQSDDADRTPVLFTATPLSLANITPLGPPLEPGDWVAVLRRVEQ